MVRAFLAKNKYFHKVFLTLSMALIASLALYPYEDALAKKRSATRSSSNTAEEAKKKTEAEKQPSGPLYAVVSIRDQRISIYDSNGLFATAPVSTGQKGHPTPTGIFTIIEKDRYHESNIYSGAPMPFMQRITWSGVALHAGVLPGYPASHGCIRMPYSFAERLFGLTKMGQRVIVSQQNIVPLQFAHARLPIPKLMPAPVTAKGASDANLRLATSADSPAVDPSVTGTQSAPVLLNPYDYAQAVKANLALKAEEAAKAVGPAQLLSRQKFLESKKAQRELKRAENNMEEAESRANAATRSLEKAAARKNAADAAIPAAEQEWKSAQERLDNAAVAEAVKAGEAEAAEKTFKDAQIIAETIDNTETVKRARAVAAAKAAEAETAAKELKAAKKALEEAESRMAALKRAAARADAAVREATEEKNSAESRLEQARAKAAEAKNTSENKIKEADEALKAAKEALAASVAANGAWRDVVRRTEPVSIFVSRKTSRLYVRQGFTPILDVPVTIRDPEKPIGTHVYLAVEGENLGPSLRWVTLTVPTSSDSKPQASSKKANKKGTAELSDAAAESPPETAAGALDRIEIPEDVADYLAERAWTGAVFIVSDLGASYETGRGTDFVILTR